MLTSGDIARPQPRRRLLDDVDGRTVICVLAAYAGLAHLVAAPEHFASWWPAGAFFVAVGLVQLAYVLTAVRRPSALAVAATLFLNLGVVLVYVASRTVGVGIGPSAHDEQGLEPVGPFDLSVAAAEVALIALVTVGLGPKARTRALDGLLVVGASLWAAILVFASI